MFRGTKFWFSFLYYITAMLPAYLLLVLQLNISRHRVINYIIVIILFIIGMCFAITLKQKIKARCRTAPQIIGISVKIEKTNGDVITFLFGVVMPSLLLPDNGSITEQLVVTLVIQLFSYVIVRRSSDIVPNATLIIVGIDTYTINGNRYILTVNKHLQGSQITGDFCRLGDTAESNILILKSEG